jgi:hypothetical protein
MPTSAACTAYLSVEYIGQSSTSVCCPSEFLVFAELFHSHDRKYHQLGRKFISMDGKCIAVAVACAGLDAKPKMVQRQTNFPTKHRVEHTCEHCWHNNYEIRTRHCQGSERNGNLGRRGGDFFLERALPPHLSPLLLLLGAGLLLR